MAKCPSIQFPKYCIKHTQEINLLLIVINIANSLSIVNISLLYKNIGKQVLLLAFSRFYTSVIDKTAELQSHGFCFANIANQ
jgi:hypothetical protein